MAYHQTVLLFLLSCSSLAPLLHILQSILLLSNLPSRNQLKFNILVITNDILQWPKIILYLKIQKWCYPLILPGHSWTLQLSVTDASPSHSLPPLAEDTFSSLFLVIKPPPHVFEHSPTCHSSHSQWTN